MREFYLEGYKVFHLKRNDIDIVKWNACVENSVNESPMAYSWVLDIMHPNWEAIIGDDYKWVFPLTIKRFFLCKFYSLPVYVQYLGFFGNTKPLDTERFFSQLKKYGYFFINVSQTPGIDVINIPNACSRTTFYLDLERPYEMIERNYSKSCKKNIRRSINENVKVLQIESPKALIKMKMEMVKHKGLKAISSLNDTKLEQLVEESLKNGSGILYEAKINDALCASAFFIRGKSRIIIFSASNNLGRSTKASFLLVDRFIKEHCLKKCYLDFAGSDIKGIAEFNMGFGAKPLLYSSFKISKLSIGYFLWRLLSI